MSLKSRNREEERRAMLWYPGFPLGSVLMFTLTTLTCKCIYLHWQFRAIGYISHFSCSRPTESLFGTTDLKGDSSLDPFVGRGYEILKSQIFNLSAVIWNYALGIACKHLPENKLLVVLEWDVYNWYFYERSNFLIKKNCLFLYRVS